MSRGSPLPWPRLPWPSLHVLYRRPGPGEGSPADGALSVQKRHKGTKHPATATRQHPFKFLLFLLFFGHTLIFQNTKEI